MIRYLRTMRFRQPPTGVFFERAAFMSAVSELDRWAGIRSGSDTPLTATIASVRPRQAPARPRLQGPAPSLNL
jgi:hypothetical protein